jgi:hypothetical protein
MLGYSRKGMNLLKIVDKIYMNSDETFYRIGIAYYLVLFYCMTILGFRATCCNVARWMSAREHIVVPGYKSRNTRRNGRISFKIQEPGFIY